MNSVEVSAIGAAVRNEKRVLILRKIIETGGMTWSQIVRALEERFQVRVNPNTVSFHLKFLLDRKIIVKRGDYYTISDGEPVRRMIAELVA